MKRVFCFCLTVLLIIGLASPALAWSSRVLWDWRDTVTTVHPSFSTTLDNGNVLVVKNGYKDPMVIEINQNKEVVWEYGPIQANSAVKLGNGNTLITDSGAPGYPFKPQVIEVTPQGKVVWSYEFKSRAEAPRYAERLSSGNTLVVTPREVIEVSSTGGKVWSYNKGLVNPVKANRLDNGHTLIIDQGLNGGKVLEVDKAGKIVWEYGNYTKGTGLGQLAGPTDARRRDDNSTVIVDTGSSRILYLNPAKEITTITHWQDVMDDLPIMNVWGVDLADEGEIYLSVSYTNGKPALVKIDDKSVQTYLNGEWLFTEVMPRVINGHNMVPAKDFLSAFGATVSWDNESKTMIAAKNGIQLEITLGTKKAVLNGTEMELGVAPVIKGNTLLMPLRAATDAFGVGLKWDDANKIIHLTVE